jgi:excisionase family DNA binding protein
MSEPTSNRLDRDRLLYSVPRAAQLLSLGTSTVWALLADGTLASVSIGRSRRIPHSELVKLCTKQEVENTPMSHA